MNQLTLQNKILLFLVLHLAAAASLRAATTVTDASRITDNEGLVEVNGVFWNCETESFNGYAKITNRDARSVKVTVLCDSGSDEFYSKTIAVPANKTVVCPVFIPLVSDYGWGRVKFRIPGRSEKLEWTAFSRRYHSTPADIPLVKPSSIAHLPDDFRQYIHFSTLSLGGAQWKMLSESQKKAILDWVMLGGNFNLHDSEASRKDIEAFSPRPFFSDQYHYGSDRYGEGKITFIPTLDHGDYTAFFRAHGSGVSITPSWEMKEFSPYVIIPAITIFAMIIGPGAIYYGRKKKNPALILVIIPAVSLASCILLLLISILRDGVAPKVSRQSTAYLDQVRGEAVVKQVLGIEAPLGLGSPVEFPERAVVGFRDDERGSGVRGDCVVEDGKIKISGHILPRTPDFYVSIKLEKRREKLEVAETENEVSVLNGLGTEIRNLVVRDSKGGYWISGGAAVGAGKKVSLRKAAPSELPSEYAGYDPDLHNGLEKISAKLANSCYQADLADNVFGDDGINSRRTVGNNFHLLIGRYSR